jgi:hypothetical protein
VSKPKKPDTLADTLRSELDASGSFDGSLSSARVILSATHEWTPEFASIVRKLLGSPKIPEYTASALPSVQKAKDEANYPYLVRVAVLSTPDTELVDRKAVEDWLFNYTQSQDKPYSPFGRPAGGFQVVSESDLAYLRGFEGKSVTLAEVEKELGPSDKFGSAALRVAERNAKKRSSE